jgi:hypothetical protein
LIYKAYKGNKDFLAELLITIGIPQRTERRYPFSRLRISPAITQLQQLAIP